MPGPVSDSYQGPSEDGPYVRCRGAMVTARRCVLAGTMRAITTMRDNASMRLAAAVRGCQPIASRRKPCVWKRPIIRR
jgi:hypothetical protein